MLQQIRLLVFDLDYLIFDCSVLKTQALQQSLISIADSIPHHVRLPDAADIEAAFREHGHRWLHFLELELATEALTELEQAYRVQEGRLIEAGIGRSYPGVPEVLHMCHQEGISAALGAEAAREYLMTVSDRHELDRYFDISLCTAEYGGGGTEEMLSDILNRAEINPSEALVLGTRPAFFEASHGLDLLTLGCAWGLQHKDALKASDFQSGCVEEILPVIRRADEIAARFSR